MSDALVGRVHRLWAELAGVPVGSFSTGAPRPVVSPGSGICPPGWVGIVAVADAVLITVPSPAAARTVAPALRAAGEGRLLDPTALAAHRLVAEVLGPAWLGYLDPARFVPGHLGRLVERLPSGHDDLAALAAAVGRDEAGESALEDLTSEVVVAREGGAVVCAAGFQRWPHRVAHLGVLTAEPARGRGLASATASAAVEQALSQGPLPQWRARPSPSRRVAVRLGFEELGWQLSLRLDEATP